MEDYKERSFGCSLLGAGVALIGIWAGVKFAAIPAYNQLFGKDEKPAVVEQASAEVVEWMQESDEMNMRIAGNVLRAFPDMYDSIVKTLAENSGYDPEKRECGNDCIQLEDIARVNLYDNLNIVEVDFFKADCNGCQELGESTRYFVTEQEMDYLKSSMGGLTQNILFKQGNQMAGLEDYLIQAEDFKGTKDELKDYILSSDEVTLVPNNFCNTDEALVVMVYDVDGKEVTREIEVSQDLYDEILKDYIIPMEGGY